MAEWVEEMFRAGLKESAQLLQDIQEYKKDLQGIPQGIPQGMRVPLPLSLFDSETFCNAVARKPSFDDSLFPLTTFQEAPYCELPFGALQFSELPFSSLPFNTLSFGEVPFGEVPFSEVPFGVGELPLNTQLFPSAPMLVPPMASLAPPCAPKKRKRSACKAGGALPLYYAGIGKAPVWSGLHILYENRGVPMAAPLDGSVFFPLAQARTTKLRVCPAFCKTLVSNHVTLYISTSGMHQQQTVAFPHLFEFGDVARRGACEGRKSIEFRTSLDPGLLPSYYSLIVSSVTHIALGMLLFRRACIARCPAACALFSTEAEEWDVAGVVASANALSKLTVPSAAPGSKRPAQVFVRGIKLAHKLFAATLRMLGEERSIPAHWSELRDFLRPSEVHMFFVK